MNKNSQAVQAAQSGKLDLAENLFLEALKENPENQGIFHNIIRIKTMRGNHSDLVDLYERYYLAHNQSLSDPQAELAVAEAAKRINNIDVYIKIISNQAKNKKDITATLALSEYLLEKNKLAEVKNLLVDALAIHGKDPSILTNLAITESYLGNDHLAESLYQEVIDLQPNAFLAHYNMSQFKLATGRPEEAKNHLDRADRIIADTPEARQLHQEINDFNEANETSRRQLYALIDTSQWDEACRLLLSIKGKLNQNQWLAAVCELPKKYQIQLEAESNCNPELQVSCYQIFENTFEKRLDLIQIVREDPSLTWNRSGKPTTGGKQTHELLAHSNKLAIQWLTQRISMIITQNFKDISLTKSQISGWGVVLEPLGYQKKHTHTESLLSGVLYLEIPDFPNNGKHEGELRFAGHQHYYIQPKEGMVVLFPSYLPHETIPYTSSGERICIAFNVI